MEFSELIKQRYSVRSYRPDPVEADKLEVVLNAARIAPTAANRQPFRLIVMPTAGHEEELSRVYKAEWFVEAPLVICACGVPIEAWTRWDGKDFTEVDVAIALDHLILAAANEGLGACWIAAFDEDAAREVFKIPESWNPICLTPLGYPNDSSRPKKRKELADIVVYEQ